MLFSLLTCFLLKIEFLLRSKRETFEGTLGDTQQSLPQLSGTQFLFWELEVTPFLRIKLMGIKSLVNLQ